MCVDGATIILLLSKEKISIMIQESEKKLKDENSDDKSRYIAFHKVDTLSRIN